MRKRRLLRTTAAGAILAAGIAAAQDAPPAKEPAPPAGPQDPPPADATPQFEPPAILAQRRKGLKEPAANAAVAAGLDWLRRHESNDGRWDCDEFDAVCKGAACSEPGMPDFDPGVTGLAVLVFLGSGTTHVEGADAQLLSQALRYLEDIQDSEGCFGPRTSPQFLYCHAVATAAVAEALWLTGDERLVGPASKARDFLLAARNDRLAWRYGIRSEDNDTSVTTYALVALRSCELARLTVPPEAYARADAHLKWRTDPVDGRTGYQNRGGFDARIVPAAKADGGGPEAVLPDGTHVPLRMDRLVTRSAVSWKGFTTPQLPVDSRFPDFPWSALTAAAAAVTALTGGAPQVERLELSASFVSDHPPWLAHGPQGRSLDLHCLLFGLLLDAQYPLRTKRENDDPEDWRPFRDGAVADLVATQRKKPDGCAAGSWDPNLDPFGTAGGRVYSTSMAILALQAPNRFPRVWDVNAKPPEPLKPGKR